LNSGIDEDLKRFLKIMMPIREAGKLGPILIQLPPKFNHSQTERLSKFLSLLPEEFNFAVEFRDRSWLRSETWSLLKQHNIAYTIVDEPLLPSEMVFTANFSYIRWHGRGERPWFNYRYSEEELKKWAPKVKEAAEKTNKVYGYFNNHFHAYAPENCLQLLEMTGKTTPLQRNVKRRIQEYISGKQIELPIEKVPTTKEAALKLGLSQLLSGFTDKGRIDRAETIRESSISFKQKTPNLVKATVRDYTIEINVEEKTIRHDCDDWEKLVQDKKICKHIIRVFLSLPQELSKTILAEMLIKKDLWHFETSA